MTWNEIANFMAGMIAITNPFGNLAIFIGLTAAKSPAEQKRLALRTALATAIILLITTWIGNAILNFLDISIAAFQLAGGLVIVLLGLSMLQSKTSEMSHTHEEQTDAKTKDSIAVIPMAIPIIAGPGALTTVILNTHIHSSLIDRVFLSVGNIIIAGIIAIALYFSVPISRLLGVSGIKIATRIMGLLLMAIAMGMLTSGLATLFPAWTHAT